MLFLYFSVLSTQFPFLKHCVFVVNGRKIVRLHFMGYLLGWSTVERTSSKLFIHHSFERPSSKSWLNSLFDIRLSRSSSKHFVWDSLELTIKRTLYPTFVWDDNQASFLLEFHVATVQHISSRSLHVPCSIAISRKSWANTQLEVFLAHNQTFIT